MMTVKKGDFGFYLTFWVKERQSDPTSDPTARDLTEFYSAPNLNIRLRVWLPGEATYYLNGVCEPDPAVSLVTGKCWYEVQDGDFADTGTYNAALRMFKGTVGAETYIEETETFKIRVIERGPDVAP